MQSLLLVVDIQDKLSPAMPRYEQVKQVTVQLVKAAQLLQIPILVTETHSTLPTNYPV